MGVSAPNGVAYCAPPPSGDRATQVITGSLTAKGTTPPFPIMGPFNIAFWGSATTSLAVTRGSTAFTVGSATGLAIGTSVKSSLVPPGTTFLTLSGTSGTLSFPTVTLPGYAQAATLQITGLPLAYNLAGLLGATVTGPGIPASTTVSLVDATNGIVTLNNAPTISAPSYVQPSIFAFKLTSQSMTTGTDAAAVFTDAALTFSGTVQIERSFDGGSTWIVATEAISGTIAQFTAGTPYVWSYAEPELGCLWRLNCIAYTSGTINYRMSANGAAAQALGYSYLA